MNNVNKEQLIRLENIGLAIADSISEEYSAMEKSDRDKAEQVNRLFEDFRRVTEAMNREGSNNVR